jgi:hypothetical protein
MDGGGSTGDRYWLLLRKKSFPPPSCGNSAEPERMSSERDWRTCEGRSTLFERRIPDSGERKPLSSPAEPGVGPKEKVLSCACCCAVVCEPKDERCGEPPVGSKRRCCGCGGTTSFIDTPPVESSNAEPMLPICPMKLLPESHDGGSRAVSELLRGRFISAKRKGELEPLLLRFGGAFDAEPPSWLRKS